VTLPPTLEDRAEDNLRFIRRTMEQAGQFTAVPGWGMVGMGVTAIAASALAARTPVEDLKWLLTWLAEAAIAFAIGVFTMAAKSRRAGVPFPGGVAQRFIVIFLLPALAGAVLTVVFVRLFLMDRLAGLWLLSYGTGVAAAGTLSVRPVLAMGLSFMALGMVALLAPAMQPDLAMAAGFGGLHLLYGFIFARRFGG